MKDITDLRNFLIKEIEKCSTKIISPEEANATANLSGKIISSLKLELMYAKANGVKPNIEFMDNKNEIQKN